MRTTMSERHSFPRSRLYQLLAVGVSLLLMLVVGGTALGQAVGQRIPVTGTVTNAAGAPLQGVTVRVEGTDSATVTSETGTYRLSAPTDGFLLFTLIGQRPVRTAVQGRNTIDVKMEKIAYLEEVVVTAYSEAQRRADITGAVSSVNVEQTQRQTSASVLQRLDAAVSGVTVEASGSPGSRSTVRIRGISSFQNNDPLYIVDGTPVQDSYVNWLNPNDIASIQVLKDASAASIYGSRASNGVVIIETTKREAGPPRVTLRARTGVGSPVRGYDDFLIQNSLDYFKVVRQAYLNAGYPIDSIQKAVYGRNLYGDPNNPTVPQYIYCGPDNSTCSNVDPKKYSFPDNLIMPGSAGTNWWKTVFGNGWVGDYNLDVAGGGRDNTYGVSFNYFDQKGTAAYNDYKRGSIRVNTAFNRGRLNVGENIALALERNVGGLSDDSEGEGGFLGKNILMQPVVPVRDIAGNFASGKAQGLGNNTNPLKAAFGAKDNINRNDRIFGNVFAGLDVLTGLNLRTRFGFNVGRGLFYSFSPITPENSEPTTINSIFENQNEFTEWTWSNTARYARDLGPHNVSLLVGQEATVGNNRYIQGGMSNLINTDINSRYIQDALGDAASKTVFSTGGKNALLSVFGKADYNYQDKYVASFTLREDGSSNLGPDNRWGTFPAVGLGWRLSKEPFLQNNRAFTDLMLRAGWGVTGNQQIPSGRIVAQFGGDRGDTYYDITGSNTSLQSGFRQTSIGNANLKWEENRSINGGVDMTLFNALDIVADVYRRETSNLLFDPRLPATAGVAAPPIVNVGKMRNTGIDFSVGHRAANWNVTLNGSHYKNEIVQIAEGNKEFIGPAGNRVGSIAINRVGFPIGSFYGYIAEGFFNSPQDVAAHAKQPGAAPGRIKFKDINGDGEITAADRTIIGNPHPDFTAGLDVGARWRAFDVAATVYGTFGNQIFDSQKDFYVFRDFSTNVRKDLLTKSWTPANPTAPRDQWTAANAGSAKYPVLDQNDTFSKDISSFYVEDGSYVRLRNIQLGYNVPTRMARWLSAARVYVQAENLFTITGYNGLDPALPALNAFGAAGDIRDQARGIDQGVYPTTRVFSVGIVTSF